jgi:transposase-like protein
MMKGKRYTTEDKIRILREADHGEKSIQDICRQENMSEVTFPPVEKAVWANGDQ